MLGRVLLAGGLLLIAQPVNAQFKAQAMAVSDCGSFVQCAGGKHAVLNQMYQDGKGRHENCQM